MSGITGYELIALLIGAVAVLTPLRSKKRRLAADIEDTNVGDSAFRLDGLPVQTSGCPLVVTKLTGSVRTTADGS
jgi:hypothetical protein